MNATSSPAACLHCGARVDRGLPYCCAGCEVAAEIVAGAGLEGWYASREAPAPRPGLLPDRAWSALPTEAHADGTHTAHLRVDGLRCASCVWLLEAVLHRTDGVTAARISYGTGSAALRFDPTRTSLETLAGKIAALGYRPRPATSPATADRDLLARLGVATFCAANVMGVSIAGYAGWLDGMDPAWSGLMQHVALIVATPAVTWSALPFHRGALEGALARVPHVDLPISLAIVVMYVHGIVGTWAGTETYLDSVTMLVALLLAGRLAEARWRQHAAGTLSGMGMALPTTARRRTAGGVEIVPVDELAPGDQVDLGPGSEIPADGRVTSGAASVQLALLTGESTPREVGEGDRLVAGGVVLTGTLTLGVTRPASSSLLARMSRQLHDAPAALRRPSAVDRAAPAFTAVVLGAAASTALFCLYTGQADQALPRAVAVLVVACPCALALSGPLVRAAGLTASARRGLLLRDGDALQQLAEVELVVLDKTGTLTRGTPRPVHVPDHALRIAAGLERWSRHPLATAILDTATARGIPIPDSHDVTETPGEGIVGTVDGERWSLRAGDAGELVLTGDRGQTARMRFEDTCREGAATSLRALEAEGLSLQLLSGDDPARVAAVASRLALSSAAGGASPDDKLRCVAALRAAGSTVLFVGDGLNDVLALKEADVGLAMADGLASTAMASDGVLTTDDLRGVVAGRVVAEIAARRVRHNLVRSGIYNLAAVFAAAGGWIDPLVAAVSMPLSSGLVLASASGLERAVQRRLSTRSR